LNAAGHNLFEWFIVIHVWNFTPGKEKTEHEELFSRCSWASLFICTVISICMCIPDLFYSLAAAQLFGIVLDFALPMMFLVQCSSKKGNRREIYWMAAVAHTVHLFGTILPLVLTIFLSGHVSWFSNFYLEILINLSVPVTHYLYCAWSFKLDAEDLFVISGKPETQNDDKFNDDINTAPESGLLPKEFRIKNVPTYLVAGFVLGLLSLGIIPAIFMGYCEDSVCVVQNYAAKTSILKVAERKYAGGVQDPRPPQNVIRKLQKERPGLIDIVVGHSHHEVAPGEYYLVEKWAKVEDISDGLIDSFANKSLVQAQEEGKWQELGIAKVDTADCASKRIGNISLKMDHSCKSVWKVVGSPDYCAWVPGCKFMRQTDLAQHAQLYMSDGSILHAAIVRNEKETSIQVSVLSSTRLTGYSGILSFEKVGRSSCLVNYHFHSSITDVTVKASEERTFQENFVPDLYAKLTN